MKKLTEAISNWIREYAEEAGRQALVVGVSGGLDSAVIAKLCEKTGMKTICVSMPAIPSNITIAESDSTRRAFNLCVGDKYYPEGDRRSQGMNVEFIRTDIGPLLDSYCWDINKWTNNGPLTKSDSHRLRRGNLAARIRANILYDIAAANNGLVVGTGNYDEIQIGYLTKGGDGLVDIEPLGEFHKHTVLALAEVMEVTEEIIEVAPSAELWDGQTDEGELGMTYSEIAFALDLYGEPVGSEELTERQREVLKKIRKMQVASEHKRNIPPTFPAATR